MTEDEWLACDNPVSMFTEHAPAGDVARKTHLLAVGILRLSGVLGNDQWGVLDLSEASADGRADVARLRHIHKAVSSALVRAKRRGEGVSEIERTVYHLTRERIQLSYFHLFCQAMRVTPDWYGGAAAGLLRCVFGNPFRPVRFDASWRTEAVTGLASGIYEDQAFDRLPVLADALEDAGCADRHVLGHCRGGGTHVRGCWVVDEILCKG
jgi:hypothetical protein